MIASSPILDEFGRALPKSNGHARPDLVALFADRGASLGRAKTDRPIAARYDAALDLDEYKNYWDKVDFFDADLSNSRPVRQKLVRRSRYETGSNGYAAGIAQTYATDLVGIGPRLKMLTGSTGFNAIVESAWNQWAKTIRLRRKLWALAHAKYVDGEGFGVMRNNPGLADPVKLDLVPYETDQVMTPLLPINIFTDRDTSFDMQAGYIDGIRFDPWGNPLWYDVLPRHPGTQNWIGRWVGFNLTPEQIPAKYVCHWYLMKRPGQHRGVPENTSSLNCGAAFRRWREAILAAAESAADFTMMLKTLFQPNELDQISPMSSLEIQKRMLTALPMGWEAQQVKSEHPNATFESFHKALINEQARPRSMPYNKAACDSSTYNYASGRLDHQTYYGSLDVDREDGDDLVLDPLFRVWFGEAVQVYGWLGGDPKAISPMAQAHQWNWPKHQVADVAVEANANDKGLKNGSLTLTDLYAQAGEDFDDKLPQMANDFFGDDDESGMDQKTRNQKMRELLRNSIFNATNQQASMELADVQQQNADTQAKVASKPAPPAAKPAPPTAGKGKAPTNANAA